MKNMPYNAPEIDIIKFDFDDEDIIDTSTPVQETYEFPIVTRPGN